MNGTFNTVNVNVNQTRLLICSGDLTKRSKMQILRYPRKRRENDAAADRENKEEGKGKKESANSVLMGETDCEERKQRSETVKNE